MCDGRNFWRDPLVFWLADQPLLSPDRSCRVLENRKPIYPLFEYAICATCRAPEVLPELPSRRRLDRAPRLSLTLARQKRVNPVALSQ